jgi:hypothetical protein
MSLVVGKQGGLMREVGQWLLAAVIVGAILNASDIKRYFTIRSM